MARDTKATYERSRALFAKGDAEAALAAVREVLDDDPAYPNAENFAGWVLMSKPERTPADVEAAIAHFERASEGVALANLGNALVAAGRGDAAIARLESAADSGEARNWLGWYFTHERPELSRAIEHLREATRLRPDWGIAWQNLAKALDLDGQSLEAFSAYGRAVVCGDAYDDAQARARRVQLELLLRERGQEVPEAPAVVRADSAAVGVMLAAAASVAPDSGHAFLIRSSTRAAPFAGIATVVEGRALGHAVVFDTGERRVATVLQRDDPLAFRSVPAGDPQRAAALLRDWLAQGGADPYALTPLDAAVPLFDRLVRDLPQSWQLSIDAERPARVAITEIAEAAAVRVTVRARAGGGVYVGLFPEAMAARAEELEAPAPPRMLELLPEIVAATRRAVEARDAFAARPTSAREVARGIAQAVASVRKAGWREPVIKDGYPHDWSRAELYHDARVQAVVVVEEGVGATRITVGERDWSIASGAELTPRLPEIVATVRERLAALHIRDMNQGERFRVLAPFLTLERDDVVELADRIYDSAAGHTYLFRQSGGSYVALCDTGRSDAEILGCIERYLEPVS